MSLEVLAGGLLTTVQDLGRRSWQHLGVAPSGAMDWVSHTLANWLVGNDEGAATLEMTLQGATVRFHADSLIALCGGRFSTAIADRAVPLWRPIWIRAGSVLDCGRATTGARLYMAIAGGIDVPEVMQSRSTNLVAHFGGWHGRSLQRGDFIPVGKPNTRALSLQAYLHHTCAHREAFSQAFCAAPFFVSDALHTVKRAPLVVRVVRAPNFEHLTLESQLRFFAEPFTITPDSNRMGYRLQGPVLQRTSQSELLSTATVSGAIQVPPDGNPIILLADRQTVGGYPVVAVVATADVPRLAQAKPNDRVWFQEVSLRVAQALLIRQKNDMFCVKAYLDALVL
ncbi:MAG: biotin-dependent carboxyltransferase family protein [Chloroherpetonaceae bacterium]|nr:biotin-dependent carboxyltransferase family protein [Chloroherpetonaceae bacterium]MDW8020132.1 biotin-dependent carboxyltransferase family protein [Chloroherpetonaceae bacterium]